MNKCDLSPRRSITSSFKKQRPKQDVEPESDSSLSEDDLEEDEAQNPRATSCFKSKPLEIKK